MKKLSVEKNIHFVGIGGIGMSGLALILKSRGYNVSGSDVVMSSLTEKMARLGVRIFKGHKGSNIPKDTTLLVYSSSIDKKNPELKEAKRRKVKIVHRAVMLAKLFNNKKGIAITGTHGKTTTTSLIAVMLEDAGLDPTVAIGGEVGKFNGNAKDGKGEFFVAEADESDASFLNLEPFYSVITNIEMEHFDHYSCLGELLQACRGFAKNTKKDGKIFYRYDDENTRRILKHSGRRSESFGFSSGAGICAKGVKLAGLGSSFTCVYRKKTLGKVRLNIPGRHNILNALAAILVGLDIGLKFDSMTKSLKEFKGAARRFHVRAESEGVILIDDYAHHPTEIRSVLDVCRGWKKKRIVAVFQPHRYTRTLHMAEDFGRSFEGADELILTDIYAASEPPIKGISINNIYEAALRSGHKDVKIMKKKEIAEYIMKTARKGDAIFILGAGDICKVADDLAARMNGSCDRPGGEDLADELKKIVRGRVALGERLSSHTSLRIGGIADIWVEPEDEEDLITILKFADGKRIKTFIIGKGTNILAKDDGFRGIMISLSSPHFRKISVEGAMVSAGAGFNMGNLVTTCCDKGLEGLESLVGIPGTVGGAVYMNAGGAANPIYRNIGEFVTALKVMDLRGNIKMLKRRDISFGYRRSNLKGYIILEARLRLEKGHDASLLRSRRAGFLRIKKEKQVLDIPSAGCIFKNPSDFQFTCGQMIDMLGLKGKRIGAAEISMRHANFIVNRGGATCDDVLKLIDYVKDKVGRNYNVPLELEVEIV